MSVVDGAARVESLSVLSRFRADFYECLPSRADTLFDLADAVLCAEGPVTSLVELSLQSSFRRGHGALYDALARGAVDEERLRSLLVSQLPDGPLMFGVDASTYPRPSAECSPGRGHHYAPCRCDGDRKTIPGWQFQWITGLEWGSSSWTLPVDVARIPAASCLVAASAEQIRRVAHHLDHLGRLRSGGLSAPLFILDQGYSASGLTHALADVPVQLLAASPVTASTTTVVPDRASPAPAATACTATVSSCPRVARDGYRIRPVRDGCSDRSRRRGCDCAGRRSGCAGARGVRSGA